METVSVRKLFLSWLACSWALAVLFTGASAGAEENAPAAPSQRSLLWTEGYPEVVKDVRAGQPLTLVVFVPLCDSALIACGGQGAGDPASLDRNLYWGRAFGVRRFFDESARRWQRVAREPGDGPVLEQLVYRRTVAKERWNARDDVEQLIVLRAVHGAEIDAAVREFYRNATQGGAVSFRDGEQERRVQVHVAGYAGHNRLMDGLTLEEILRAGGAAARAPERGTAVPSFVFACRSAAHFSEPLTTRGSRPLVMTRDLMAPEGYIVDAVARGLGDHATLGELRDRVIAAYARYQRMPERTARTIFAR